MSFLSDLYHNVVQVPMTNLVQVFENITHDTGLAFVLVGVVANLIMFPIYKKMYIDGQKMRYITPKLTALQDEYKKNPQMMLLKRGELLKKHDIRTGRNFLIILIQLPFLFAIFNVIRRISEGKQITEIYKFIHEDGVGRFGGKFLGIDIGAYPADFSWGWMLPFAIGLLMYLQGMYLYRWAKKPNLPLPVVSKKKKGGEIDFGEQLQKSMEIQMIYVMPIIYAFTNFLLPIGLNAYLIAGTVIGTLRQMFLTNHYNKHAGELMKDLIEEDPELQKQMSKTEKGEVINKAEQMSEVENLDDAEIQEVVFTKRTIKKTVKKPAKKTAKKGSKNKK